MANVPVQMLTATAEREDSTAATDFVDLVPTPGFIFATDTMATFTALFVTECRVSVARARLEARILVDDVVLNPGTVVLTNNVKYETRSHLGFKTNIRRGEHHVRVQWRVIGGKAYVRNRSFTVWELR